jgi:hypothetical protein
MFFVIEMLEKYLIFEDLWLQKIITLFEKANHRLFFSENSTTHIYIVLKILTKMKIFFSFKISNTS